MKKTVSNPAIWSSSRLGSNNNNGADDEVSRREVRPRLIGNSRQNYTTDLWPPIDRFLSEILTGGDGDGRGGGGRGGTLKPERTAAVSRSLDSTAVKSFEYKYRLVYSCVVNSHGERLANDLFSKVKGHVKRTSSRMESEDAVEFILNFYGGAVRLFAAFARIQEVFIYFDRSFLRPKMGFDVGDELTKLLKTLVFDFHGHKLLSLLRQFVDISAEPHDIYAYLVAAYRRLSPEILESYPDLANNFSDVLLMENGRDGNNNNHKIGEDKNEVRGSVNDKKNSTGKIKESNNREFIKSGKTDYDALNSSGPRRNGVEE